MVKSKTLIEKQVKRKTNPSVVETIILSKKNKSWKKVAEILSGPSRKIPQLNLSKINDNSKEGEVIVVPGKVLSQGEVDKKIEIVALSFSEKAREKLLNSKVEIKLIKDEIKKNPEGKKIKILFN